MLAREQFDGSNAPFEGDRTVLVRSLPEGAQITRAVVTLQPVAPPGRALFEERITFPAPQDLNPMQGTWGATKASQAGGASADPPGFVEIDFHARRTLVKVSGSNLRVGSGDSTLQVDLGGLFVPIDRVGAIFAPDGPEPRFQLGGATGGSLPSIATTKFKLTVAGLAQDVIPDISEVTIRSTPSNITLRLGQQPPFFARPGELAQEESCPDFSQILQVFLADAEVKDGFYEIPLTVHTDTIARLNITIEVEYVQEQNPLPDGLSQATLMFDHSSAARPGSATIQVTVPAGARVIPGRTTARVRGSFQNSRIVYGPTGDLQPSGFVPVNPSRAQATPLIFLTDLLASAVDVLLAARSRTAQFALDLVKDVDGKPWTESVLPEPAKLAIDSEIAGRPTWVNVPLPAEVQLKAGVRYWLVLQSLQGEAAWYVGSQSSVARAAASGIWTAGVGVGEDTGNAGPVGLYYTDNGGLSWRQEAAPEAAGPLAAFVHLRQPAPVFQMPIALQVGEGEAARRVSLDRFQPLGRVDFSLDFDEVAEAINQVAAASSASNPPVGEHLRNNEFDAWRRIGDLPRMQTADVPRGSGSPEALAVSSDGEYLYVVNIAPEEEGSELKLAVVDTTCHELQQPEISLGTDSFYGMAVSPGGQRAFVLQDDRITWVDLESRTLIGSANELGDLGGSYGKPLFSPDGGRLYVLHSPGSTTQVLVLDTGRLEAEFRGEKQVERAITQIIPLDSSWSALVQIMSPDGSRLYILAEGTSPGNDSPGATAGSAAIFIYELDSGSWAAPIQLHSGGPFHMALNPEGSRIVVTNGSALEVTVFETRRGQSFGSIAGIDQGEPGVVAIDPAGRLAYLGLDGKKVVAFDIARIAQGFLDLVPELSVVESLSDLAISPSGEWLYAASSGRDATGNQQAALVAFALGAMVPEEWTLTSGEITPFCILLPPRRVAVLGLLSHLKRETEVGKPTAISQVVPVVGGTHYLFTFAGVATTPEAVAEVFWYGDQCSFQREDRLSFEVRPLEEIPIKTQSTLPISRLEMISPARATLAEVRFSVPGGGNVVLDNVSLQATADALSNSDLQAQSDGRLAGWQVVPAGAVGLTVVASAGAVTVRNGGSAACALQQVASFRAEQAFRLSVAGQGLAGSPLVRLEWLGVEDERLGTALEIPLIAGGADHEERTGVSPLGTEAALLSLVLPPGASLSASRVSLEGVEVVSVPISFVAQAPGELTVSDVRVVYEMAPSPPPGIPAQGLCSPTPPGASPGSGGHGHYHCPNCGEEDELCDPEPSATPAGAPALEGNCCHCGARLTLPGGSAAIKRAAERKAMIEMGRAPLVIRRPVEARQPDVRRALLVESVRAPAPTPPPTVARPPRRTRASRLIGVAGLNEEQAKRLVRAGIGSLTKLSRAEPEAVASILEIAPEAATAIVEEAKRLRQLSFKRKKE